MWRCPAHHRQRATRPIRRRARSHHTAAARHWPPPRASSRRARGWRHGWQWQKSYTHRRSSGLCPPRTRSTAKLADQPASAIRNSNGTSDPWHARQWECSQNGQRAWLHDVGAQKCDGGLITVMCCLVCLSTRSLGAEKRLWEMLVDTSLVLSHVYVKGGTYGRYYRSRLSARFFVERL